MVTSLSNAFFSRLGSFLWVFVSHREGGYQEWSATIYPASPEADDLKGLSYSKLSEHSKIKKKEKTILNAESRDGETCKCAVHSSLPRVEVLMLDGEYDLPRC